MSINDSWEAGAKCRGWDVNLFDPDTWKQQGDNPNQAARALCEGCPVMRQCAEQAIKSNATGVIRAGACLHQSTSNPRRHDRLHFLIEHGRHAGPGELAAYRHSAEMARIQPDSKFAPGMHLAGPGVGPGAKEEVVEQHRELSQMGLTGPEIAVKLNVPLHTVHYLNRRLKKREAA